jgi:type VI secretion system protein VasD
MWTKIKMSFAALLTFGVFAGCVPEPTSVAMNFTADANVNGGLPVKATVFYLTSTAKFNSADYGTLASNPAAALGADLMKTQSVLLSPGDSKQLAASFDGDGPSAVGVIVGFRALSTSQWRTTTGISGGKANALTVTLGSANVKITK